MKKLFILITALFIFLAMPSAAEDMNRGVLNNNIVWNLSENGTLTISGSGEIKCDAVFTPWYRYYAGHVLSAGGDAQPLLIDRPVREVVIDEGITSIPNGFFINCSDITNVKLPKSLRKIGSEAFRGCSSLAELNLPDNLDEIGTESFAYCPVKEIILPAAISSVTGREFSGMNLLERIIVPKENENYVFENGRLYDRDKTRLYFWYMSGENEDVFIEGSVKHIGEYVFRYKKINRLVLPPMLESVGAYAFAESEVGEGQLPRSVKFLADSSFAYCNWITYADISNAEGMGAEVFSGDINLKTVIMPQNIKVIGNYAFSGCSMLESAVINKGTEYIGKNSFRGCTGLKSVTLPEGLITIDDGAFDGCLSLPGIKLPESLEYIGRFAFQFCTNIKTLVIPENVQYIGDMAFCACDSLTNLVFCGAAVELEYAESNRRIMDARYTLNIYYNNGSGWEKGKEIYPDGNWIEGIPNSFPEEADGNHSNYEYENGITAYLPVCRVTLNNVEIDNTYREYPFLQYRNIVYFPMTYFDCRFLGVETVWDNDNQKLSIGKSSVRGEYCPDIGSEKNIENYTVEKYYNSVVVNGKEIITANEPYALLKFRDVIYFPLTWKYSVEEFGWQYSYDAETGLNIEAGAIQ